MEAIDRMQDTLKGRKEALVRQRLLEEWGPRIAEAKGRGDKERVRVLEEEFPKALNAAIEESGAASNDEEAGKDEMPPLVQNAGATAEEPKLPEDQEKARAEKKGS